jgi:tetratricopeptide (TPR) repeat protein
MVLRDRGGGFVKLVFATALLLSLAAHGAEDEARARSLYLEGQRLYDVGEYERALDAFKDAYLVKPDPNFLFNIAQCHRQMGDPVGAVTEYRAYLRRLPDAPNRALVERFIADGEKEIERWKTSPTGGERPTSTGALNATGESAATQKPGSRKWLWATIAVTGAVVIAVGVGLGVGLSRSEAPPATTLGNLAVHFQ